MTDGLLDLVALGVALGVILVGAELFTNGIEWFGHKLDLAEGAVGSVLAAVGTALPETMIPTVAILFGGGAAAEAIGVPYQTYIKMVAFRQAVADLSAIKAVKSAR